MSVVRRATSRTLSVLLAALLAVGGVLPALPAPAVAAPFAKAPLSAEGGVRVPKNVDVRWAPDVPRAQIAAAADRLGFRIVRESAKLGWAQVTSTRAGVAPETLLAALRTNRLVSKAHVERIYTAEGMVGPNDPLYGGQWGLDNHGQTGGTPGADISAVEAWARTTGSKDVVVAVVDTGMDYTHADLRANIWRNPGEIAGNGIDDDGNGFTDDIRGYDFGNRDASVYDPEQGDQHATHVAGIIGAATNNAAGIAGVNWDVTIMPVKFLVYGSGTDFDGAEAMHYAVDNGADIINCSWGGGESELLDEAVAYAASRGVLVVCAAGNDGMDVDEVAFYPGCIDSTAIINVAATDHDDELAFFSNYGRGVDLAAPGVDVTSTLPYEYAGMLVDSFPYRVALLGFPLEDVRPGYAAQEILERSMSQLSPMTDAVLVVDDSDATLIGETPGERLEQYVTNLDSAGYSDVATWCVESQGVPTFQAMDGRTVVWFTGVSPSPFFEPMITAPERAALGTFLDAGGRLLMSTGDGVLDLMWYDGEWAEKYLHVYLADVSAWGSGLKGFAGTAFEGIEGVLSATGDAASDTYVPADDSATPIFGLGGYGPLSGTSMAAPHVSGAAALLMAEFPSASAAVVKDRLLNTVDAVSGLRGKVDMGGRLNAAATMNDFPGRPEITEPDDGEVLRGGRETTIAWRTSSESSPDQTFEAQLGLPATSFTEDFEDGTLGAFVTTDPNGWTTTSTAAGGSFGAASGSALGISSMWTTVTIPGGGAELSFEYWYEGDPWTSWGVVVLDDSDYGTWFTGEPTPWQQERVRLPEGEHRVSFIFVNYQIEPAGERFGIDDVAITGFDFQPVATAPAGATSATFTAPAIDAAHAKLRVRSHLGPKTSAWSDSADVRIAMDADPPAVPDALSAVAGGDGDVNLSWTNPSAGEGTVVRVLRRIGSSPSGPEDADAVKLYEGTATSLRDAGLKDGDDARYAAYAIDGAENVSAPAFASAAVVDHTAPPAVTKLHAGLSGGVARVVWLAPPAPACSSVKVLRRTDTTPTGPDDATAAVVYEGSAAAASDYMLTRHPFTGTAYYAVFPRDPSGNVGPRTAARLAVDTTGLKGSFKLDGGAAYCTSTTVVASSEVTDAVRMRFDVGEGYGLWETYAASRTLVLASEIDGLHVVKAEYENASGVRLELTGRIFLELAPPEAPTALKTQPWNDRARLTWTGSRSSDVTTYTIYTSGAPGGPFEKLESLGASALAMVLSPDVVPAYFRMTATDMAGMESAPSNVVEALPGEGIVRVAGDNRYATAVKVSKRHFPSAETVVLATGENFADALSASGLAGSYDAPILLTRRDSLPATVSAEIARLGAKKVFVIGSTSAIATSVAESLESSYTVKRVFGADRYGTAAAVARELDAHETTAPTAVALVNGTSFADGTAIAAAAYAKHMPVLLAKRDVLPGVTKSTIDWLGVETVYIVGGESAISWEIEEDLDSAARRLDGVNRYETAAYVATMFCIDGTLSFEDVFVASGRSFPDALTGGAAAGKEGGVVLLSDPRYPVPDLVGMVGINADEIGRLEILGGSGTISEGVEAAIRSALDFYGPVMPEAWDFPEEPDDRGEDPGEMG